MSLVPVSNFDRLALVFLLRYGAVVTFSAFFAMLLPLDWMVATHRWLGLGDLPRLPVVEYLARSVAALYGFHGVLLFLLSTDPVRYLMLVKFVGVMNVLFGAMVLFIDLDAGMPVWWTAVEGPGVIVLGVLVLFFAARLSRAAARVPGGVL